jgi:hypothetical protein
MIATLCYKLEILGLPANNKTERGEIDRTILRTYVLEKRVLPKYLNIAEIHLTEPRPHLMSSLNDVCSSKLLDYVHDYFPASRQLLLFMSVIKTLHAGTCIERLVRSGTLTQALCVRKPTIGRVIIQNFNSLWKAMTNNDLN